MRKNKEVKMFSSDYSIWEKLHLVKKNIFGISQINKKYRPQALGHTTIFSRAEKET